METIYIARIIKRTGVEKIVHDESMKFNKDIKTVFMFDETDRMTCHRHLEDAEKALKEMMELYDFKVKWMPDRVSFMYGSRARYHSSPMYLKNGNAVDYFAIIDSKELA